MSNTFGKHKNICDVITSCGRPFKWNFGPFYHELLPNKVKSCYYYIGLPNENCFK